MMGTCKGKCLLSKYEPKKTARGIRDSPYVKCSVCVIFIKYEGVYCPCCGVRVSRRSKGRTKYKGKYIE